MIVNNMNKKVLTNTYNFYTIRYLYFDTLDFEFITLYEASLASNDTFKNILESTININH